MHIEKQLHKMCFVVNSYTTKDKFFRLSTIDFDYVDEI